MAGEPSATSGRKRRRVIAGLAVVGVVAVAAGAFLAFGGLAGRTQVAEPEHAATDAAHGGDEAAPQEPQEALVVAPLDEIIVNIAAMTASGRQTQRFLKLNVALVYDSLAEGADRLAERQPYIRDAYVDYLRLLSERDLSGSAGLARLRSDLLHRARTLAETDAPREVLVVDLVIQ
ncbi:flagellar basal body-associated FliL family protein [Roseibacterium sp. SDUM158017]|nr:flagellar basal body-associated FliL family protein [Roseibacterium sp. SDUM158017]